MSDPVTPEPTNDAPTGTDDWLNDVSDETEVKDKQDPDEETQNDNADAGDKPAKSDPDAEQQADKTDTEEADLAKTDAEDPDKKVDPAADQGNEDVEAERKRHDDEMAKQRIRDREALDAIAKAHVDEAQSAIEAAGDDETKREIAELKVKDAQRDAAEFRRNVETNQSIMTNDLSRATREVGMFRQFNDDGTPNPEFNGKALERALEHLSPHLITYKTKGADDSEIETIVGTKVSVYDFLKKEADDLSSLIGSERTKAAVEGQQAEQQMRANAEPGHSGTPQRESAIDKEAREMKDAFAAS